MGDGSSGDKIAQIDKGKMKRVLGVLDLFSVGYGDLGSSIYYALGITAFFALGATPIALLIAGIVFVCTALTYAEMSSVMSDSGGSASYSRKTFNDLISFIAGWGLLLDYIVTIAISSYAVAPYLSFFIPALKIIWVKIVFTVCLIAGLLGLNVKGSQHSTRLSIVLTSLTVVTQLAIIVIGSITLVRLPELLNHLVIGGPNKLWSPSWTEFWHGVAMAMVAYTGIESMAQLSAEAKEPSKTVPRAIMLAMGTLLIVYMGISVVALSALTPQELSTKWYEDPIAGIVQALPFGGAVLGPWIGLLGAVILMVAANAGLMGASRLSFNMGEFFQLPRAFYNLHKRYKTPYISLIIFAILAALIVIWSRGKMSFLADLYNFGAMLAFFCAHLSLIFHRIKFPDMERPFRVPLNIPFGKYRIPVTAIIGVIASFLVWCLVVVSKPDGRYLGIVWIALGLIMYFTHRRKHKISATGKVEVEKIKVEDYKEHAIKKILLPTRGHLATETVIIGCDLAKLYNAEITVVHVVEVSYMMPINTPLLQRETYSEAVLKRAQAIGIEKKVNMSVRMIRSRSVTKAICDLIEKESYDLLILGARKPSSLGPVTEKIMQNAMCRVWVCRSDVPHGERGGGHSLFHHKSHRAEDAPEDFPSDEQGSTDHKDRPHEGDSDDTPPDSPPKKDSPDQDQI